MEATGAFGHGLREVIQLSALRIDQNAFDDSTADKRTWACTSFTQYWSQRISCAFWRGTALMFKLNTDALASRRTHHGEGPRFDTTAADEDLAESDDDMHGHPAPPAGPSRSTDHHEGRRGASPSPA